MASGYVYLPTNLTPWVEAWAVAEQCTPGEAQVALSRRLSGWQYEGWLSRMSYPIYVTERGEEMLRTLRDAPAVTTACVAPQGHPQVPYSS